MRHFPRQLLRPQLVLGVELELKVVLVVRKYPEVMGVEKHQREVVLERSLQNLRLIAERTRFLQSL